VSQLRGRVEATRCGHIVLVHERESAATTFSRKEVAVPLAGQARQWRDLLAYCRRSRTLCFVGRQMAVRRLLGSGVPRTQVLPASCDL
jgi:hypothetical protein